MKVNMPMAVTAADTIKRTITGTIVSWDEQGNTSVGPTVFAKDSIEIKPVRLLLEHDRTRPIGKMVSHNVTANGIEATFKIANTMAGEDALVEATEGLRDGAQGRNRRPRPLRPGVQPLRAGARAGAEAADRSLQAQAR